MFPLTTFLRWEWLFALRRPAHLTTYDCFCVSREFHSFYKLWEHFSQTQGPPSIIKEPQWSFMTSSFMLLKHHFTPHQRGTSPGLKWQNAGGQGKFQKTVRGTVLHPFTHAFSIDIILFLACILEIFGGNSKKKRTHWSRLELKSLESGQHCNNDTLQSWPDVVISKQTYWRRGRRGRRATWQEGQKRTKLLQTATMNSS